MFAVPRAAPVTSGWAGGAVWPAATVTVAGEIVTFEVSLLVKVITTPPAGAAAGRLTASGFDWPIPTVALAGTIMVPALCTVTLAVASVRFAPPA